jgi:hypothetical protein
MIIVLYILIFMILDSNGGDKGFRAELYQVSPILFGGWYNEYSRYTDKSSAW